MARHRIRFRYSGNEDDTAVEMAFSKKRIEERKERATPRFSSTSFASM